MQLLERIAPCLDAVDRAERVIDVRAEDAADGQLLVDHVVGSVHFTPMPTVLRSGPYRLFFYSGDRDEPPHVHVERDENQAKFWLNPVRLQHRRGFDRTEVNRVRAVVVENETSLLRAWHAFFGL